MAPHKAAKTSSTKFIAVIAIAAFGIAYISQSGDRQKVQMLANSIVPLLSGGSLFSCSSHLEPVKQCQGQADVAQLDKYVQYNSKIHGWMHFFHFTAINVFDAVQRKLCISGSLGEIGIHHGKFFLALASHAAKNEKVLAIDLFETMQELNVDGSGKGNREIVEGHISNLTLTNTDITLLAMPSQNVTVPMLQNMGFPAFRMFSVDGGHTFELTNSDLMLASCLIHPGGVVIVDDFVNVAWSGVVDSVVTYLHAHPSVAPVLWGCNKLYLTSSEYHEMYMNALTESEIPCMHKVRGIHESRFTLAGWKLCISTTCDETTLRKNWANKTASLKG